MEVLLILLNILKVLGILILAVLAVLLVLMLLFLFVPFRYSFSGVVDDPKGSTEAFHLDPWKDISVDGDVRWLLGAVHAIGSIGGTGGKEDLIRMELRLFGMKVPVDKFRKWLLAKKKKEEEKEEPRAPEEKKSFDEKLETFLRSLERVKHRVDYSLNVLQTEYGMNATQEIKSRALAMMEAVLPREWGMTGIVGLGDPARSAKVFALQGILYPLTDGHVAVGTEFDLYRYDLRSTARGSIRIFTFVRGGVLILLSRDVRRMFRRLRRGPARVM